MENKANKKKNIHPLQVQLGSFLDVVQVNSSQQKSKKKLKSGFNKSSKVKTIKKSGKVLSGFVYVLGLDDQKVIQRIIKKHIVQWQHSLLEKQLDREMIHFSGKNGPVWIYSRRQKKSGVSHYGRLEDSDYSWHRDQIGPLIGYVKAYHLKEVHFHFISTDESQECGTFVGLDLAAYSYKQQIEGQAYDKLPKFIFSKDEEDIHPEILKKAKAVAQSTNLARHLVNTPPNFLNPVSCAEFIRRNFSKNKNISIEVWDEKRLQKEGMGLHLGVGQGSENPPRMIHIKYRNPRSVEKPIAFVGKGVTFDTGGLDIKPSSNMRYMKKDMGGVAALIGLANWVSYGQSPVSCDIYLGLAENSVDSKSMRPSDVLTARNGMKVEVHNTDAEGRLVLADVIDVAVTKKGKDEPRLLIDVATLTGAIKAGLGADIAGLFANHDILSEELHRAGFEMGEPNWRMPLFSRYTSGMDSAFADIVNCIDGFGGAITAALFLEKFVQGKPWAHLDIYAWNDRARGALSFAGGSGQSVQTLIHFLEGSAKTFDKKSG